MSERGQGRTTEQMLSAPPNAAFVWCNNNTGYVRALARHLKRRDLKIVSPHDVEQGHLKGLDVPVVVDHAAPAIRGDA